MTDIDFINIAIDLSKQSRFPYGAIIVKDGEIIGRSDAQSALEKTPFQHAEMVAIEQAVSELGGRLGTGGGGARLHNLFFL